jgi:hypothetical protein
MKRKMLLVAAVLMLWASSAHGLMLCMKAKGGIYAREMCRKAEHVVDPSTLGLARVEVVTALQERIAELEALTEPMSLEDDGVTVRFSGVNVQVVNGEGYTDAPNGAGNLIVGYNEDLGYNGFTERTGSHNLIVGKDHAYNSYGGLVAGHSNAIVAPYAAVTGGFMNEACGWTASVTGGMGNVASSHCATVSGGAANEASGLASSVSGGEASHADEMCEILP